MVYFEQILHTYACQHCLTTGMRNKLFMDEALLSISQASRGQLVKMLITLEQFCVIIYFTLSSHWYAKQ